MAATLPATTATRDDLDHLAEHDAYRRPDEVTAFMEAHPKVIGPLHDAVAVVSRYFGPETSVVLEVERDRDAEDHSQLSALIQTDEDVEEGLARCDRFAWEWWLDALPRAAPHPIFGLE